jgi:hypothetical protein
MRFSFLMAVLAAASLGLSACGEELAAPADEPAVDPAASVGTSVFIPHFPDICRSPMPTSINLATQWDSITSLWGGRRGVVVTVHGPHRTADDRLPPLPEGSDHWIVPPNTIHYYGIDPTLQEIVFIGTSDDSYDYSDALNWTAGSCHPNSCSTLPPIPHNLIDGTIGIPPGGGTTGGGTGCVEGPANLPGSGTREPGTSGPLFVTNCSDLRHLQEAAAEYERHRCHY